MPLSSRTPIQRDSYIYRGPREVRDLCCGRSNAADLGKPGAPSHHWGADDAYGECAEWDLLWVGPNDVVVVETTVVTLQVASEP